MEYTTQKEIESQAAKSLATYNTAFNLTQRPATDIGILAETQEIIYPQYALDSDVLDFNLEAQENHFYELSSVRIYLQCKVVDSSGTLLKDSDANSKTAPCNNIAGTLFKSCEIALRNVPITNNSSMYHYISYFNNVLSLTKPVIATEGNCIGFYRETTGEALDTSNEAYKALKELAQQSAFELIFSVSHPLFAQQKYLPFHIPLRIRLRRNDIETCMLGEQVVNATFKDHVVFTQAYLQVKKVIPHSKIVQMYQNILNKGGRIYYNLWEGDVVSYRLASGIQTHVSDTLLPKLPSFCCVSFVASDLFNGSVKGSPFEFQSYKLNNVQLLLDGEPVGFGPVKIRKDEHEYKRIYRELISLRGDHGNLDYTETEMLDNQYFIIPLFSQGHNQTDRYYTERHGSVKIQLNFAAPLAKNINVLFYYIMPKVVSMDKQHIFIER